MITNAPWLAVTVSVAVRMGLSAPSCSAGFVQSAWCGTVGEIKNTDHRSSNNLIIDTGR